MLVILFVLAQSVSASAHTDCPDLRQEALDKLFVEVHRVTGGDEITLAMMDRYESRLPRITRWVIKGLLGGKGTSYVLRRCEGADRRITLESANANKDTCISTCVIARAVIKFVDWGMRNIGHTNIICIGALLYGSVARSLEPTVDVVSRNRVLYDSNRVVYGEIVHHCEGVSWSIAEVIAYFVAYANCDEVLTRRELRHTTLLMLDLVFLRC